MNTSYLFICYPKCTTCQKAKKWLEDQKIPYTQRDIKEQKPTLDELTVWHEQSQMPVRKFFNTSGLLYKAMNLKDRLKDMSETEQLALLATDGMLVKRPILVAGDQVAVGFNALEWEQMIGSTAK
jgi:arsenate reductase